MAKRNLAIALDIGTTTISGSLIDIKKGRILSTAQIENSQVKYGDDVITRIDFVLKSEKNLNLLKNRVRTCVNTLIRMLLKSSGRAKTDVDKVALVGNSCMQHLFLGISPQTLATPPYRPAMKEFFDSDANQVGLDVSKTAEVIFLPNIGGFVGSDALAGIIALGLDKGAANRLIVDIGTNGEIVLSANGKLLVASTAAGPAFEARHISCGMPAQEGAIEKVRIRNKKVYLKTIKDKAPKGICGSGLIDAISQMLKSRIIDSNGRMQMKRFYLYESPANRIYISQEDVRKVQIAKAAIRAGIEVLLKMAKVRAYQIKSISIAGTFGNLIDRSAAISIGLLPALKTSKIRFAGNAALRGAQIYILKGLSYQGVLNIVKKTRHIILIGSDFKDSFMEHIRFPG